MTDRRFNRLRMPAESDDRPPSQFAGIESRRPTPIQSERARLSRARTWKGRRLAAKLDELLGSPDDELALVSLDDQSEGTSR